MKSNQIKPHYSQIQTTVIDYLNETFEAPFLLKTDKFEIGTVLYTANPYWRTNATIVDVILPRDIYVVLTDIGNIIHMTAAELLLDYFPPEAKRHSGPPPTDMEKYFKQPNTNKIILYK